MLNNYKVLFVFTALAMVAGCATTPPAEDPVLTTLVDHDERIDAIERVLASALPALHE